MGLVEKFDTKYECDRHIRMDGLEGDAIAMPRYSECDGELLYWYVYYV